MAGNLSLCKSFYQALNTYYAWSNMVQRLLIYFPFSQRIPRLEGKEVYVDEQFQNDMTNTKIEVCVDFSGDIEYVVQKNDFIADDV